MENTSKTSITYNKEYLSSLNKEDKIKYIKEFVNNVVKETHDLSLVKKDEQPNTNIIYSLYSDGSITREKGGWAYKKRSIFGVAGEIVRPANFFTFPCEGSGEGYTYAVMTEDNCRIVRELMNDLLLYI
jgi:hypothetical protein